MRALLRSAWLAITLGAVMIGGSAAGMAVPARTDFDLGGGLLMAAIALTLIVRHRWPLVTLAVVTALTTAYLFAGYPLGLVFLGFAAAVYTVARHLPLARSLPAAVAALGLLFTHLLVDSEGVAGFLYGSAWMVIPFAFGVTIRARHEVAARDRAEAIRAHVDDERLRLAQEVHDIVGHGLAAIKMQADVALHVLAKRPEQAEPALTAISRTSSEALEELRVALAEVRDDGRSAGLGLGRLDELRRRMGEAGLDVDVQVTGSPRGVPAMVDLTGYRIVQESLTNAARHARHARGEPVTLRVSAAAELLTLEVANRVAGAAAPAGGGRGLAGMRERVALLGGRMTAGDAGTGWWRVRVRLPLAGRRVR